jgi:hypothetical protein
MRLRITGITDRPFSLGRFDVSRLAAAVVVIGGCSFVVVSLPQPANGAATDAPPVAVLDSTAPDLATPAAANVPVGAETTPTGAAANAEMATAAPPAPVDTAQAAAVSPVIPQNQAQSEVPAHLLDAGERTASTPVAAPSPSETPPQGASLGDAAPQSPAAAPAATPPTRPTVSTTPPQTSTKARKAPRYHHAAAQYQLESAAKNSVIANSTPISKAPAPTAPQTRPKIAHKICGITSCERRGENDGNTPSAPDITPPQTDPLATSPISAALGEIGASTCANANISVRISSPGDDGPVAQAAGAGDCGHNTNISIRINSPGDNGPVSQTIRPLAPPGTIPALAARIHAHPLFDPAGAGPGLSVDPTQLAGQLDRRARRLTNTIVANTQAKAGLRPAGTRHRARSSRAAAPRARAAASAQVQVAGSQVRVSTSASASITAAHHARHRHKTHAAKARTASASRLLPTPMEQVAHSASGVLPQLESGHRSGLSVSAMLAAFAAAMAGAYLLVPPGGVRDGAAGRLAGRSKRGLRRR